MYTGKKHDASNEFTFQSLGFLKSILFLKFYLFYFLICLITFCNYMYQILFSMTVCVFPFLLDFHDFFVCQVEVISSGQSKKLLSTFQFSFEWMECFTILFSFLLTREPKVPTPTTITASISWTQDKDPRISSGMLVRMKMKLVLIREAVWESFKVKIFTIT